MSKRIRPALLLMLLALLLLAAPAAATEGETPYFSTTATWDYTLTHSLTLENTSSRLAYNIQVQVPLMDSYLPIYVGWEGEQLAPYPAEIRMEPNGQRVALYHIPYLEGNSSLTLRQIYAVNISSVGYSVDPETLDAGYSKAELDAQQPYLQAEPLIEANNGDVVAFAARTVGKETNLYRKAQQLFSAVNLALNYSEDNSQPQNAAAVLSRRTAHCEGYTNLYVACLRAVGIPARVVSGYLYMPERHMTAEYVDMTSGSIRLDGLRHVWVEFYLPQTGWVAADPTFTYTYEINGQTQKFVDLSYFANVGIGRRYVFFSYGDSGEDTYHLTYTGGELHTNFSAQLTPGKNYVPFNDLEGHWSAPAVTYSVRKGYFNGISPSVFGPDQAMSRAMFVTVLGRLYQERGGQLVPYQADLYQFTDIKYDDYYTDALGWALDMGLIEGYGNGRFGPDDPITREQMAKMLAFFVDLLHRGEEEGDAPQPATPLAFTDMTRISPWAWEGVQKCVTLGLLTGHNDGNFKPRDWTTRGQVATILQRVDELIK